MMMIIIDNDTVLSDAFLIWRSTKSSGEGSWRWKVVENEDKKMSGIYWTNDVMTVIQIHL